MGACEIYKEELDVLEEKLNEGDMEDFGKLK